MKSARFLHRLVLCLAIGGSLFLAACGREGASRPDTGVVQTPAPQPEEEREDYMKFFEGIELTESYKGMDLSLIHISEPTRH